ncbi:hypothetical protein QYF36_008410 [Acer negundo]|nr:hypothetical protein QYF36_008410 [Acer negundo]
MDLKARLELKLYNLSLFQGRVEQNEHHKLSEVIKKIEQELEEAKYAAKEKQLLFEERVNTMSMLEKTIREHDNNRERRLKDFEKKIKAVKVKMRSGSKDLKREGFNKFFDPIAEGINMMKMAESTEATMQNIVMMENDFRKAFAVNTGVGEEEFDRRIEEDVVLFQANGLSESDLSRGLVSEEEDDV